MIYKFVKDKENYEDLASGRVLFNAPGTTAFPVRLASEIFQRAASRLQHRRPQDGYTVYDPCCGGAYWLTTVGMLHGDEVGALVGSDVDADVLRVAEQNLSLLREDGLNRRIGQLEAMRDRYGKASHREALASALRLKDSVLRRRTPIATRCFRASATERGGWPADALEVDLLLTDVPYGDRVQWVTDSADPIGRMLERMLDVLHPAAVAAIVADKRQTIDHPRYQRVERHKIGKRQIVLLELK